MPDPRPASPVPSLAPKVVAAQTQHADVDDTGHSGTKLPAFAKFPRKEWRTGLPSREWEGILETYIALISRHLEQPEDEFQSRSVKDESLSEFMTTFASEAAQHGYESLGDSPSAKRILRASLVLYCRLLASSSPPSKLTHWEFIANMLKIHSGWKRFWPGVSESSKLQIYASLAGLKRFLIQHMNDAERHEPGPEDDVDRYLHKVIYLMKVSPEIASLFMEGSDFLDGIIECYPSIHKSRRRPVVAALYSGLVGLARAQKWSALADHLYTLKAAVEKHKAASVKSDPLDRKDDLVGDLVYATYLVGRLGQEITSAGNKSTRLTSVLKDLASSHLPPGCKLREKRWAFGVDPRALPDKGKRPDKFYDPKLQPEKHKEQMKQVEMVKELFPELGSKFIARFLDECDDHVEQVITHLLENTTPDSLKGVDRSEELADSPMPPVASALPLRGPNPDIASSLPPRRNVFDGDELDRLVESNGRAVDPLKMRIGKRQDVDADKLLADRSTAPKKESILSALAAFDSDDDERDDTYDADDVGKSVDVADPEADAITEDTEAKLYQAYMATPKLFDRDNATRRGIDRVRLRHETGMTDEAIEGWAIVLGRDFQKKKRLQARYGDWTGKQNELAPTAWRRGNGDEEDEDEENEEGGDKATGSSGGSARGGVRAGRGGGRGRGRGRGRGGGAPPGSEHEKRQKEANKASRANHNRRDGHAKKMARGGGFPS